MVFGMYQVGGLSNQSNFDNRFIHSGNHQPDSEMDDEFVSSFAEKNDGSILIGIEFGNLNQLDRGFNSIVNIPFRTESNGKIENIKYLLMDRNQLWIKPFFP